VTVAKVKQRNPLLEALVLLEGLADAGPDASAATVATRLGLNPRLAARLIGALEEAGLVERPQGRAGHVALSMGAVVLGRKLLGTTDLLVQARPVMEDLADALGETVCLTVLTGDDVVVLDTVRARSRSASPPTSGPALTPSRTPPEKRSGPSSPGTSWGVCSGAAARTAWISDRSSRSWRRFGSVGWRWTATLPGKGSSRSRLPFGTTRGR
jgi:hypothetical protein